MAEKQHRESRILHAWQVNAGGWIDLVDHERIPSRKAVTNRAIVEVISDLKPLKVLDLGCGEGWLTRTLTRAGINATGVDGILSLIENARSKGHGSYACLSYEEITAGVPLPGQPFDLIVINFGLFTDQSTEALLAELRKRLVDGGLIVIQTLHPCYFLGGEGPYQSEWKSDAWAGLEGDFQESHEWFFRTLSDWISMFVRLGFRLGGMKEPLHPETGKPASVIFILVN